MRKEAKAAIAIVLAVWFFIMGFELGSFKERKKYASQNNPSISSTAPTQGSTAPTTEAPTTQYDPFGAANTAPSVQPTDGPSASQNTQNDPSKLSKDEIVNAVNSAYKALEAEQNFSAHKNLSIRVTILSCSVESAVSAINDIINGITDKVPKEENLVFAGGVATNSEGTQVTVKDAFPPDVDFALSPQGVASATATKQGDNTVYNLTIIKEDTTIASPIPQHNATSVGYLDITSLGLPSVVNITKGDMHYPGSTMKLVVNAQGKIVEIENHLPMTGEGEAKVMGIGGNATFEGALDEKWVITY